MECWCSTQYDDIKGVVYDFAETRGGRHAREFIGDWKGKLVCDDYAGYKALFENGIIEAGCMAHARRKFHDLWANHSSQIAGEALTLYGALYDIERDVAALDSKRAASDPAGARRRSFIGACKHWDLVRRISATRAALPGDGIANGCVAEVSGSNLVWCDSGRFRERCV